MPKDSAAPCWLCSDTGGVWQEQGARGGTIGTCPDTLLNRICRDNSEELKQSLVFHPCPACHAQALEEVVKVLANVVTEAEMTMGDLMVEPGIVGIQKAKDLLDDANAALDDPRVRAVLDAKAAPPAPKGR